MYCILGIARKVGCERDEIALSGRRRERPDMRLLGPCRGGIILRECADLMEGDGVGQVLELGDIEVSSG